MNIIVGREKEKKELKSIIESNNNELVCVYGRRRIGKTYLIKEYFNNKFDFYYTGTMNVSNKIQLSLFQSELNEYSNNNGTVPKDWFKAFANLKKYLFSLNKKEVLIFIDELPWMDAKNSFFIQAFTNFWNTWDNHNDKEIILKCICCGSYASWMLNKFIGDKGGLYGRITRRIYLQPFTLLETEEYFHEILKVNYSKEEITNIYMIVGGIPYYLSMIDAHLPLSSNIDNLFFNKNGKLREEYSFLFRSLFTNSTMYQTIVEILSTKNYGLTREEIIKETKIDGGTLTRSLDNLIHCDFIRENHMYGNLKKSKIYMLSDFYCLFYLRFVKDNQVSTNFWTNILNTGKYNAWRGYAFEQVCFNHIEQIRNSLGISGIVTSVSSWRKSPFVDENGIEWKGGQIDLLIDRSDMIINVCEIKFSNDKYLIDKEYKDTILKRIELFKKTTKTKKTLKCTFITNNGLKENINNDIVDFNLNIISLFN